MKNSSITCIQKQLNNGYQTIISFGKKIQKPLTKQKIALLEKQLKYSRAMETKQLWTSKILQPVANEFTGEVMAYVPKIVQGTYNYSLHGELGVN